MSLPLVITVLLLAGAVAAAYVLLARLLQLQREHRALANAHAALRQRFRGVLDAEEERQRILSEAEAQRARILAEAGEPHARTGQTV